MYSINIKGKVTPKDKKLVKLEIIFSRQVTTEYLKS